MNCISGPYYIGLYWERLSGNACIVGTLAGIFTLFFTEFQWYRPAVEAGLMVGDIEILSSAWCMFVSIFTSVLCTFIFEVVNPKLNDDTNKIWKWDDLGEAVHKNYGESRLTGAVMKECCKAVQLPSDTWLGWFCFLFAFLGPPLALPWGQDEFVDDGTTGPFPQWAFNVFTVTMFSMGASIVQMLVCYKPDACPNVTKLDAWAKSTGADKLGAAQLARRMSQEMIEHPDSPFAATRTRQALPVENKAGNNQVMPMVDSHSQRDPLALASQLTSSIKDALDERDAAIARCALLESIMTDAAERAANAQKSWRVLSDVAGAFPPPKAINSLPALDQDASPVENKTGDGPN
jgi:hypothetical protein